VLRLLLLRHAKSSPGETDRPDFDRHLIPRGRRAATRIGEYLAEKKLVPDLVLCSSARRTRDTLAALLPFMRGETEIRISGELYESSVEAYLTAIGTWGGKAQTLLIIGHNPTMEEAAAEFLVRSKSGGMAAIRLPTAGLCLIEFDIPQWDKLRPGTGRLVGLVEPKSLAPGVADFEAIGR